MIGSLHSPSFSIVYALARSFSGVIASLSYFPSPFKSARYRYHVVSPILIVDSSAPATDPNTLSTFVQFPASLNSMYVAPEIFLFVVYSVEYVNGADASYILNSIAEDTFHAGGVLWGNDATIDFNPALSTVTHIGSAVR